MGASFLPLMMFTLLWGGVGIVLPFLVPKGATQGLPDSSANDQHESQQPSDSSFLSFHPKYFDFKESPVGVPRLGVVRVDNRLKNENLKLISISGNTVHFHSSFFADKVIGPESNTTFEVVFLSRVEGLVESNLYIHTSKGLFKYYVKGYGLPNPYRLKPLVGARIPVNGTYEPLITMHNTHDTRIQVVEMHSSGADFHLQLPNNGEQDVGSAWAIEPFETKPVMRGSFQGKADGNHTGFIKIRVNSTAASSEYLLLPVEVQVSSEPGMYSPQDSLDFGLLVQTDKPKTMSLSIINAERSPVNIQSVSVKGAPNPAVKIEFRPVVIEPDNSVSIVVALVTFDPSQAYDPKWSHGMIQILSECGKTVTVPFRAAVMHGQLEYNASSLGFFVKSDHIPPRNFSVRNNFSATVAIYHVDVSHPDLVKVNSFNQTHVIPPGEQKTIFSMRIQRKGEICDARHKIEVTVKSNITNIRLPLMCYDGKLQMHTFENGEIDCGRLEMYSSRTEYFSLENKNPVEIRLKSWGSNSSWGHVELVGMQKGVKEDLAKIKDFDSLKKSLFLQPGHMAVFSIDVRRPTAEGSFYGEAYVTTDHNQTLRVPYRFAVSKGSVYSDAFVFDKVFPGKISCEKLYLGSSFNRSLLLSTIRSKPSMLMWFSPSHSENPEIPPMRRSYVGKVHFDPRKFCDPNCYAGFSLESAIGKLWAKGARLGWEGGELDWDIFTSLQSRFESVSDTTVTNISMWVDTNEMSGYKVVTQVNYIWPRMSIQRPIVFPLTALGNESMLEIPVNNPSSFPILVQAVLADDYGPQWSRFTPSGAPSQGGIHSPLNPHHPNSSGSGGGGSSSKGHMSSELQAFKLSGVLSTSSQQNGSMEISDVQTQLFKDLVLTEREGDHSPLPGITFLLPAGAKYYIRTSFKPYSKDIASTVILLRNNLTGVEAIVAKGRAGTGQLTVGSGTPGSALLFQLTEKLLQACQTEPTSKYVPPQLTVRRSFIARNIGEIPLDIRGLEIYPPQNAFFGFQWQLPFGWDGSSILGAAGSSSGSGGSVGSAGVGASGGVGVGSGGGGVVSSAGNGGTSSFAVLGEYCEGYGFRILNCHPFTLQPNHTHSIDIAFSPDFTMSKVVRTLRLVDSTGGEFNYTLVAMIPSKMLSICSSVISRPSWEYLLKIFLVIGVGVAVIASALMAYVEAGSIVSSTVLATVRVVPGGAEAASGGKDPKEATSKLDLKAVYDKVENRFKRNGKENSSSSNGKTGNSTTQNNALVVSKSGGGGGGLIANGTGVLSNNNNSTLRNRRGGKKEQQGNSMSNSKLADKSNNQKSSSPSVEDNSLNGGFSKKNKENSPSSVGGGESGGGGGVPSSSNSSKKKKGGGGGGGGGGQASSSSNNASSPLSTSSTNAQVNSSTKKKRHRNSSGGGGSGGSGSLTNVCLVTGSSGGKGLSKAEQEDTSSTTTESSNSDDFYISPADKKSLNHQNHQRKGSRANSPEDSSSCSGTSHSAGGGGGGNGGGGNGGKGKKDGKKNKQGMMTTDGKLDGDLLSSVDMSSVVAGMMIQKGGSPSTDDGCSNGKKKNGKRKEQQNNNMFSMDSSQIGKGGNDGKTSPVSAAAQARHQNQMHAHNNHGGGGVPGLHHPYHQHHDMAMWDSPQRPMGDGLSELAAQTEAFVMHRPGTGNPGKKTGSAEHLMGQPSFVDGRLARNSHSPPMANVLQMANYQAQQQQMHLGVNASANLRHRRHAGIIGQRYGPPPPGGMGVLSPSSFYQQQNGSARQHTPPTRAGGAPGLSGGVGGAPVGGWGTDILPDNGCDIWSRKSSLDNNGGNGSGGMAQTFSSVAGSASSASSTMANDLPPMYSTGNMVPPGYSALFEGFPASSSPGLSNRSSDDGGYYSLGSAGGNTGTGAGGTMVSSVAGSATGGARNGVVARNSQDNSQLFGYGMEIFNSLNLPLSSTYEMGGGGGGYRSSVSTVSTSAGSRAPQVSMSGGGPATGAPSHNYLHRMRSEPVAREEPRGFGTTSKNWNDLGYFDMENIGLASSRLMSRTSNSPNLDPSKPPLESNGAGGDMPWRTSASPTGGNNDTFTPRGDRSLISDWSALAAASSSVQAGRRSVGNESEIWAPANLGASAHDTASKWPSSFENPSQDSSSVAVGSGGRAVVASTRMGGGTDGVLGDLGFCAVGGARNNDAVPQSHREVEAGLGFNPFTSNIWNQNHSADTSWSSSSASYRYNNRD